MRDPRAARHGGVAVGVLIAVALAYTFPWDRYLILQSVWGYPDGRVLATVAGVPVEEVAFFAIQTWATGLVALALRRRLPGGRRRGRRGRRRRRARFRRPLRSGWRRSGCCWCRPRRARTSA